jgi:hypothetical protein
MTDLEQGEFVVGYARGLSNYYQDGTERMEIWISKKYERFFPNVYSEAIYLRYKHTMYYTL